MHIHRVQSQIRGHRDFEALLRVIKITKLVKSIAWKKTATYKLPLAI